MNDPIRLLDAPDEALPYERELLEAARKIDPPAGAREKIWAVMGPHLGSGGGGFDGSSGNGAGHGSSGMGSSGTSISGTVGGFKSALLGMATATTVAGGIAAAIASSSAPVVPPIHAPLPRVEASIVPIRNEMSVASSDQTSPQQDVLVAPSGAPPIPPDVLPRQTVKATVSTTKPAHEAPPVAEETPAEKQERASRLRDENRLLGDARSALRSGDPAAALEKLDAVSGSFPDGVLGQEREVLAIEALAKSGQREAASARASAFVQAYPTSPHAPKVRGFIK